MEIEDSQEQDGKANVNGLFHTNTTAVNTDYRKEDDDLKNNIKKCA